MTLRETLAQALSMVLSYIDHEWLTTDTEQTVTGVKHLTLDDSNTARSLLRASNTRTGTPTGTPAAPIEVTAGDSAHLNDPGMDRLTGLLASNYTANGAAVSVGNHGSGDGIYAETDNTSGGGIAINVRQGTPDCPNATGKGVQIERYGQGNALDLRGKAGSQGPVAYVHNEAGSDNRSVQILDDGSASTPTLDIISTAKCQGQIINVYHANSAFHGIGILLNLGNSANGFDGDFLSFRKAGQEVFAVDHAGTVRMGGGRLYAEAGVLKWRNAAGVVTVLA